MEDESYFVLSKFFYLALSLVIARAVYSAVQICRALRDYQKRPSSKRGEWMSDDGIILFPSSVIYTNVRVNQTFLYSELLTPISDPQYFFSSDH